MGPEEYKKRAMDQLEAVYRLALTLTRRADEAEDLVQETYLRALKPSAIDRFDDPGEDNAGMRAWLMTICHNCFYTSIRKRARAHATTDTFLEASSTEPEPGEACPAWSLAGLDWEQVDGSLKRAIDELKPEFRAVLLLWGVEGLKYREIALTVVFRTVTNLRREAFHRVIRLPLKDVVTDGPSNAIARVVMDTTALGAGFNALIAKGVAQVTKGIAAYIAALIVDWRMTLIATLTAPIIYTVIRRAGKKIRRASRGALRYQPPRQTSTSSAPSSSRSRSTSASRPRWARSRGAGVYRPSPGGSGIGTGS